MASCNHTAIIEKINYTNEIMGQLRALLLPYGVIDSSSEIARDLFDEAIRSLTSASLELRSATLPVEFKAYNEDEEMLKLSYKKRSKIGKRAQISDINKRRKVHLTLVTPIPHEDGYQWRKYGQKKITNENFLRNYYKCTHFKDKGCPSTKTVQQKDSTDNPPKFTVSYSMQHTCKTSETNSNQIITMDMDRKFVTSTQEDQTHACRSILTKPPGGDEASASVLEFEEFDAIGDTDYEAITRDINEIFPNFYGRSLSH